MFWRRKRLNAVERWGPEEVAEFLQGGGRFSLDEWARLDPETRRSVAHIGRAFLADIVSTLAAAIHDPNTASQLGAAARGPSEREEGAMAAALGKVGRKIMEAQR